MTEVSNAVKVLIARMETHPEEFNLYDGERWESSRFAGTAQSLYGLCGLDEEKKNAFWFLNDTDKEALIAAWKQYHLTKLEKEVMEKVFDEGYDEREREKQMQMELMKKRMYQQQMVAMQQAQQAKPSNMAGGYIHSSQNSLLGAAGSAFQGLFK